MSDINYSSRIERLRLRYNPDRTKLFENRVLRETSGLVGDTQKYVRLAMMAVDDEYTQKSRQAGEVAKGHLSRVLSNVDYRYQGSVMTDTHIRGASDIDLLVLCTKFNHTDIGRVRSELYNLSGHTYSELSNLRSYSTRFSPYLGNCSSDLRELRLQIEHIMLDIYDICDISKPKSVKITNQSLHRDVDVVTACWYDSYNYVLNGENEIERAISIYDKDTKIAKGPDYPFLRIERINRRSAETNGRLKRMIRFLKNVRSDSDKKINLSSFEINAVCYSIPVTDYVNLSYLNLVFLLWSYIYSLLQQGTADQLMPVVGDERVFTSSEKIQALKLLSDEVWHIYQDLIK